MRHSPIVALIIITILTSCDPNWDNAVKDYSNQIAQEINDHSDCYIFTMITNYQDTVFCVSNLAVEDLVFTNEDNDPREFDQPAYYFNFLTTESNKKWNCVPVPSGTNAVRLIDLARYTQYPEPINPNEFNCELARSLALRDHCLHEPQYIDLTPQISPQCQ